MKHDLALPYDPELAGDEPAFGDVRAAGRERNGLETALHVASELAVVWAFGLALLLILAQRA